jgi:YqaJ-like viral recombinase domain
MTLKIFSEEECPQGSREWKLARAGWPTASMFKAVCAQAQNGKDRKTRDKYMRQLAGERYLGEPAETYVNDAMNRGKEHEPELLIQYAYDTGLDVQRIGFARDDEIGAGASSDGWVESDGIVETKSINPGDLIEVYTDKEYPTAHRLQLQGNLWVCRREWIDVCCGYIAKRDPLPPKRMPLYRQRVYRDESVIKMLALEVKDFNEELARMVRMIERMA